MQLRDYKANEVRNVVVLGHSGAGKSSLIEAAMFYTKEIDIATNLNIIKV